MSQNRETTGLPFILRKEVSASAGQYYGGGSSWAPDRATDHAVIMVISLSLTGRLR